MRYALAMLVLAAAGEAQADGCDTQALRIAGETGATVLDRTDSLIALRHPIVDEFRLHCDGPSLWKVSGGGRGRRSLGPAAAVIARAASLALPTSQQAAETALSACIGIAARTPGVLSEATRAGLTVECTVFEDRTTADVRQAVE